MTFSANQNCLCGLTFNSDWRIKLNSRKFGEILPFEPDNSETVDLSRNQNAPIYSVDLKDLFEHKTC